MDLTMKDEVRVKHLDEPVLSIYEELSNLDEGKNEHTRFSELVKGPTQP